MPEYEVPRALRAPPGPPGQIVQLLPAMPVQPAAVDLHIVNPNLMAVPGPAPGLRKHPGASMLRKALKYADARATAIYKTDKKGNPRLVFVLDHYESYSGKRKRSSSLLEIITLAQGRLRFARVEKSYATPTDVASAGGVTVSCEGTKDRSGGNFLPLQLCPLRGRIPPVDRTAEPRCKMNAALWKFYQDVGLETVKEACRCYRAHWQDASTLIAPMPA